MGQVLIVDGKVVYGDVSELQLIQLVYVNQEIERLQADMMRLQDALDAAKATLDAMKLVVSPKPPTRVRVQASPPGVPEVRRDEEMLHMPDDIEKRRVAHRDRH